MSESRSKTITEVRALKRPRYFDGKLIAATDLQLEQEYFRQKSKLHNRSLHGFGIISGLQVTVNKGQVVVEPGLALDCEGNELVVDTEQSVGFPTIDDGQAAYLTIRYVENATDPIPNAGGAELSTITESFELAFAPDNCNRGHRHLRARWLACGKLHALTIAKLRRSPHGWRVDRGYRPPAIK